MAETRPTNNRRQTYSTFLIGVANLILVISLLAARSTRIVSSETPFLTIQFLALFVFCLALIGLSSWLAFTGWLVDRVEAISRSKGIGYVGVWIGLSYAIIMIGNGITDFMQPYLAPFVLWLTVFDGALLIMVITADHSGSMDTGDSVFRHFQPKRIMKGLFFVALSIMIPLLILEISLRAWFTFFGSERERAVYTASLEDILELEDTLGGQPYTNFGLLPDRQDTNSLGYRGAEFERTKPAGTYRIVALGGSTTYGISLSVNQTYPAKLQKILREDYDYLNVEVINGGVVAYSSYDTLANFLYRVLDIDPDMIIVYHAVNDVVARLVDPEYYNGQNPARGIWRTVPDRLSPSTLYRYVAINLGWMRDPSTINARIRTTRDIELCQDPVYCANLGATPGEILAANPPTYFERNLRNLIALAETNHVLVMLSSWAYFPEPVNGGQYMTYHHMQQGVAEHNAITERLAEALNVPFYDLAGNMPSDESLWIDGLHMTPAGTQEMAAQYAAFLIENGLLPLPVQG
jgi:lysophospholipase L1-like esterase